MPRIGLQEEALPPFPPGVSTTPAIALSGLAQRLGVRWALRGVDLVVPPGELVAVVGHNGSGKTTLLRVVSTALRPTRGGATVFGHDLRQEPDGARALTAMLTHSGGLYGDLTAAENLAFAQRMCGGREDRSAIDDALNRVGMLRWANTRVRTFSSGMQRRTALARLHLRRVKLLLLDEPYNTLDGDGTALVDELLADVRQRGGAALVVLHDFDRSRTRFDRIVELRHGVLATRDAREAIQACRPPKLELLVPAAEGA